MIFRYSEYLFLFHRQLSLESIESKFVSNFDTRCFHDFFVVTFDFVLTLAQDARELDFGANFQIVASSFTGNGRVLQFM